MPDRTNLYKKLLNLFCYSYLINELYLRSALFIYYVFGHLLPHSDLLL